MSKMKQEIKTKWVNALRSGEYTQGRRTLRVYDTYCCLGVLCQIYVNEEGIKWDDWDDRRLALPPNSVLVWSGLKSDNPIIHTKDGMSKQLSVVNDNCGYSFDQIADLIEDQL